MEQRAELVHAARRLDEIGGFTATDGNLSARISSNSFWISPAGVEKGEIVEDDFVQIDENGRKLSGQGEPSSEWAVHLAVYREREDICAILHTHTPHLTAFAAAHKIPDTALLAEAEFAIGGICLVPYALPSSTALAEQIIFCGGNPGVYLLENHGAIAVGKTAKEALHRMERAEFLAKVTLLAEKLGGGIPLSKSQLQQLQQQGR